MKEEWEGDSPDYFKSTFVKDTYFRNTFSLEHPKFFRSYSLMKQMFRVAEVNSTMQSVKTKARKDDT